MDLPERYVRLCLRVGRHIDGFVDAYVGPPEWKRAVAAEELADPRRLQDEAAALLGALEDAGPRGRPNAVAARSARGARVRHGTPVRCRDGLGRRGRTVLRRTADTDRDERLRGGASPDGRRAARSGHPSRAVHRLGGAERRSAGHARPRARATEGRPRPACACARLDAARGGRQLRARVRRGLARIQLVPGRVPQPHRRQRGPPDLDRRPRRSRRARGVPRSSHGADGEGRPSAPCGSAVSRRASRSSRPRRRSSRRASRRTRWNRPSGRIPSRWWQTSSTVST